MRVIINNYGVCIAETDTQKITDFSRLLERCTLEYVGVFGKTRTITRMAYYKTLIVAGVTYYIFARFSPLLATLTAQGITPQIQYRIKSPVGIAPDLLLPGIEPTENQAVTIEWIMANRFTQERADKGRASCLLVMDTGLGKTYVSGVFIGLLAVRTLVIIPKKSALNEWIKMLNVAYPELKVGAYMSDAKRNPDADVMITTSASANKDTWIFGNKSYSTDTLFKTYGLVVYDEIHNYATENRAKMFWKLHNRYVLGITATPDEHAKNMDEYYYRHVGHPTRAADLPGFVAEEVVWDIQVDSIYYTGPPEYTKSVSSPGQTTLNFSLTIRQFLQDPYRLTLVITRIRDLYAAGKFIYVFAEQRKMLEDFKFILSKALNLPVEAPELGLFLGGISEADKQTYSETSRIILITYGYGAESLSIVKMDTLVFLTPRKAKMMQVVGRILRRSGDTSKRRTIIDIVDAGITISRQFSARKAVYKAKNCILNKHVISYKDIQVLPGL